MMHFVSAMRQVKPESEADLPEVARRVRQVFAKDLLPHLAEEEHYALPLLRAAGYGELADEVFAQHEQMRAMDLALEQSPTTALLVDFVHMLEKHVELEESEVWDVLDLALTEDEVEPN